MLKKLDVKVVGPEPGCKRCQATAENVKKFAESNKDAYEVQATKINIADPNVIAKYGILKGPAVIVNDTVVSEGEVPAPDFLKKAIKKLMG